MIWEIILITLALEILTILGRIKFGSWREQHKGKPTVHIHHLYIGILVSLSYLLFPYPWVLIIGASLFFSDAIHHFIVLPIWQRKTEFP